MEDEEKLIRDFFNVEKDSERMALFLKAASENFNSSFKEDAVYIISNMLKELLEFPGYFEPSGSFDEEGNPEYDDYDFDDRQKEDLCNDYAERILKGEIKSLDEAEGLARGEAKDSFDELRSIAGEVMGYYM